jgi:hypothetical protein
VNAGNRIVGLWMAITKALTFVMAAVLLLAALILNA